MSEDIYMEDTSTSNIDADTNLRPQRLREYIGQSHVKDQISILIESALKRESHVDHILLFGLPGLGKTTLAQVVSNELNVNIVMTSGQAIEKTGDAAALLSNLGEKDILFIDEIHRLKPKIEELFYTAMEDFAIDIILGKGPTARSMRLSLPPFTLIGATTKLNKISSPMRDRFGCVLKLEYYESDDICDIVSKSAEKLDLSLDDHAIRLIAKSSRKTPRVANRLLKRVRDVAVVKGVDHVSADIVNDTLRTLGINDLGLSTTDLSLLRTIHEHYSGGPVGLSTLSAALNEEKESIENIYEPFLMQLGFLKRSQRGRLLTRKGIKFVSDDSLLKFN